MVELQVCIGSACHVNGSNNVITTFQHLIERQGLHDKITLSGAFCMRKCVGNGVSVKLNGEDYRITAGEARSFFRERVIPLTEKE